VNLIGLRLRALPRITEVRRLRQVAVQQLRGGRLDVAARARRRAILQHRTGRGRAGVTGVIVADKLPTADDVAIAGRLLAAHRASRASAPALAVGARDDVWTQITADQGGFAAVLQRGDAGELAAYLCNVSRHDASIGITQGDGEHRRLTRDPAYRRFVALMATDKLVSLAEAVGVAAVENPEQGSWGNSLRCDPAELVDRISERIGIDVAPPDVDGGLLKIDTGRGLFHERDANAIYAAYLLRQTTRGLARPRICEIGGGSGRVAYWSRRLGPGSYTLVDLPHVNVVQGWYALKSLPAGDVSLYGEQAAGTAAGLRILPAHAIAELHEPSFDIVLNQDSFPEMNAATVADYLVWIAHTCQGSLMSINHESKPAYGPDLAHISVPELAAAAGTFELTSRFPYWLRRGYVVELYRVSGPAVAVDVGP
jgi:hypothetical protein